MEADATELQAVDKLGKCIQYRQNMYNPIYYLLSYCEGYQTSTPAAHWRIHTGIKQTDTATTVETNLALENYAGVKDVEFTTVWDQGHTEAERTGDSTTNRIVMNIPIAKSGRETRDLPYQPEAIIQRLRELLRKYNESYREASLRAGLDHQAIRRIFDGQRPNMTAYILLRNHFGVNPNEFLQLAGWPALELYIRTVNSENLPVEAVEVALALAKISDPGARKKKAEAVLTLINV